MNAKKFFTEQDKERIRQAVIAAESKTAGEIIPMIVTSAARYTEIELFGVFIGLFAGILVEWFWSDPWGSPYFQLWPVIGAFAGFLISRLPAVKRIRVQRTYRQGGSYSSARVIYRSGSAPHARSHRNLDPHLAFGAPGRSACGPRHQ